jgi:hypothetical protein
MEIILIGFGILALLYWRPFLTIALIGAGLTLGYVNWPSRDEQIAATVDTTRRVLNPQRWTCEHTNPGPWCKYQ